jgi:hypothetical protein
MTERDNLHVEVRGDEIIVTLPLRSHSVTYYKPASSHHLLAKKLTHEDDPRVRMTSAEFLAIAWRLASDKPRELGWIV